MNQTTTTITSLLSSPATLRHRNWRMLKDWLARPLITFGGILTIITIVLIFFYLLYVVMPMFESPRANLEKSYDLPGNQVGTLYYDIEELARIATRVTRDGKSIFFDTSSGDIKSEQQLPLPAKSVITAYSKTDLARNTSILGLSNGAALLVQTRYKVSYPNDIRTITPEIIFPAGEDPIPLNNAHHPIDRIAMRHNEDSASIAFIADGKLWFTRLSVESSMLDEDTFTLTAGETAIQLDDSVYDYLLITPDQQLLYAANKSGEAFVFDITGTDRPEFTQHLSLTDKDTQLTSLDFLLGGISLLAGDSSGVITQWFPVRDAKNIPILTRIRDFQSQSTVTAIAAEHRRKGFIAADQNGQLGIYHSTAQKQLLLLKVAPASLNTIAIAPRADAALLEDADGQLHFIRINNEHPEISWSSLWGKIWYESHEEPEFIWQSSAATNDFEPKFSLTPLSFGTMKAAFYAMLLAIPLSILGAIYTAYFMTPAMRRWVKPGIEIMGALPTVILGFLAGLWLAPWIEAHLPGVFTLVIIIPFALVGTGLIWDHLPRAIRHKVPEGWHAALLIPVVLAVIWVSSMISQPMEQWLFDGNMRTWMGTEFGIVYDQRNSIIIGLAMGFAVIPTIFSIAEDAIFGVPKHLTFGSLALGATPWQTLVRVVILTASPGIFSAVMIGFGRAIGETMIVLMATGNTPVMDMSIFEGMRTLAANIAVEMPESAVDSTHYRVLFLAALVLFIFTFILNTVAEVVREHLRRRYSSL